MYLNVILAELPVIYHGYARKVLQPFLNCVYGGDTASAPDKAWNCGSAGTLSIAYACLANAKESDTVEITTRRALCAAMAHALCPDGRPIGRFNECPKYWRHMLELETIQWSPEEIVGLEREMFELVSAQRTYLLFVENGRVMVRNEMDPMRVRPANSGIQYLTTELQYGLKGLVETWDYSYSYTQSGGMRRGSTGETATGYAVSNKFLSNAVGLTFELDSEQQGNLELLRRLVQVMATEPVYVLKYEYGKLEILLSHKKIADIYVGSEDDYPPGQWKYGFSEYSRKILGTCPIDFKEYKKEEIVSTKY